MSSLPGTKQNLEPRIFLYGTEAKASNSVSLLSAWSPSADVAQAAQSPQFPDAALALALGSTASTSSIITTAAAAAFAASSSTCILFIWSARSAICFSMSWMFDMATELVCCRKNTERS